MFKHRAVLVNVSQLLLPKQSGEKSPDLYSLSQFLWYRYSHDGCFPKGELGRRVQNWPLWDRTTSVPCTTACREKFTVVGRTVLATGHVTLKWTKPETKCNPCRLIPGAKGLKRVAWTLPWRNLRVLTCPLWRRQDVVGTTWDLGLNLTSASS